MIEPPFLGVGDVHRLHDRRHETPRQFLVSGNSHSFDAEPFRILNRAVIILRHAERERRHIVHEEIRKMFRRNDD